MNIYMHFNMHAQRIVRCTPSIYSGVHCTGSAHMSVRRTAITFKYELTDWGLLKCEWNVSNIVK